MALGDFASRRLPPEWVQVCDQWLSACLTHSRAELGPDWLELYLNAPLWRFAWAPGVIDAQWWSGVLMPSCDKVGRYFPLVVAQAGIAPPQDANALTAQEDDWYLQVAQAALQTLDGLPVADFEAALAQIQPWPGTRTPTPPPALTGCSLWWSWLPDQPAGPVQLLTGLPRPERFSAMLDGRW
jgi:type VI secretion system protein ImpM